jgi:hypothetical protein
VGLGVSGCLCSNIGLGLGGQAHGLAQNPGPVADGPVSDPTLKTKDVGR